MFVSRNLIGLRLNLSICFKTSPVRSVMLLNLLQPNNLQLANSLKRLAVQH
jgi:hypothetical protein